MKGYIHSVETFGTVDDGGIRYVLFMQGCAMRCAFCQNPDTWLRRGQAVTVSGVLKDLQLYRRFIELSGGGLTVSGGEPLLQWKFVRELFGRCRAGGIHCTLDTSGYCRHGEFRPVLDVTDRVLFSIKVIDPVKHEALTGVKNDAILGNLSTAAAAPVELVVRYVFIPGINDGRDDLARLVELLKGLKKQPSVDILPYHKLGVVKWEQLGLHYPLEGVREPAGGEVEKARTFLIRNGLKLWK